MFSEVDGNCKTPDKETQNYRLNHTMIRVKNPTKSVDFYISVDFYTCLQILMIFKVFL